MRQTYPRKRTVKLAKTQVHRVKTVRWLNAFQSLTRHKTQCAGRGAIWRRRAQPLAADYAPSPPTLASSEIGNVECWLVGVHTFLRTTTSQNHNYHTLLSETHLARPFDLANGIFLCFTQKNGEKCEIL